MFVWKNQLTGNLLGNFVRMLHTSSFLVSKKEVQFILLTTASTHCEVNASIQKCDIPRHLLCLKGIISMDFSKGAMICLLLRAACWDQWGWWRRRGGGLAQADSEVPLGGSSANPTELLWPPVFYRRRSREESKWDTNRDTLHVLVWMHIHTYWLSRRAFLTSTVDIWMLLSRTHSHRGVRTWRQERNEGRQPCEEHKHHMI